MKVFITPRPIWPILAGDCIRANQILEALCQKNDKVHCLVLTGIQDLDIIPEHMKSKVEFIQGNSSLPSRLLNSIFKFSIFSPLQFRYFYNRKLEKFILENRCNITEFVLHTIRGMSIVPISLLDKVVLDYTDSLAMTYERALKSKSKWSLKGIFYFFEYILVKYYERTTSNLAKECVVISEEDKSYIGNDKIKVVPNWVDFSVQDKRLKLPKSSYPLTGVMIGNFRTLQNQNAAQLLLDWSYDLRFEGKLNIIFAGKNSHLIDCKGKKHVTVFGEYDELADISNVLHFSFCLTTVSGGLQNKIIETGVIGLVNIITPNVVKSSVAFIDQETCIVVNNPKEFTQKINSAVEGEKLDYISKKASEVFISHFEKKKVLIMWGRIL